MKSDDILVIRKLIDRVKEKFGENAYLELFTDGSGYIRVFNGVHLADLGRNNIDEPHKLMKEFDGLGELAEILTS